MGNLNIYHINCFDYGGAFNAAYRLHEGLLRKSVSSKFAVKTRRHPNLKTFKLIKDHSAWNSACQGTRKCLDNRFFRLGSRMRPLVLEKKHTYVSDCISDYRIDYNSSFNNPSLFHFHWIANIIDWKVSIRKFSRMAPIVWTLHDLNPLGGIWHYTPYPDELSEKLNKWNEENIRIKTSIINKIPDNRIHLVAPSQWMLSKIKESNVFRKFSASVIPNGMSPELFTPMDKVNARLALGLPLDCIIAGFIAGDLEEQRKGFHYVYDAFANLNRKKIKLVTVGNNDSFKSDNEHFIDLGRLEDNKTLNLFYSSLDFLISASEEDNLPNTVMEALACGVPVLGFDRCGVSTMIKHKETGWLVDNEAEFVNILLAFEKGGVNFDNFHKPCRSFFNLNYNESATIEKYLNLYNSLS